MKMKEKTEIAYHCQLTGVSTGCEFKAELSLNSFPDYSRIGTKTQLVLD